MTTTTLDVPPSRAELHLAMRAAVLSASPREHGRQQARRVSTRLAGAIGGLAAVVGGYDLLLLAGIAGT